MPIPEPTASCTHRELQHRSVCALPTWSPPRPLDGPCLRLVISRASIATIIASCAALLRSAFRMTRSMPRMSREQRRACCRPCRPHRAGRSIAELNQRERFGTPASPGADCTEVLALPQSHGPYPLPSARHACAPRHAAGPRHSKVTPGMHKRSAGTVAAAAGAGTGASTRSATAAAAPSPHATTINPTHFGR